MFWTVEEYLEIVVGLFRYKLLGWPGSVKFANLSDIRGGQATLDRLSHLWRTGRMRFVKLTDEEYAQFRRCPFQFAPAPECAHAKPRKTRSHLGRRMRPRRTAHGNVLTGPKTPVEVPDEEDISDADDFLPGGSAYKPASC